MSNIFKRGYEAVEEEKKKQDAREEARGKQLYKFFLKNDGDEADIHFLTEEPITFYEHCIVGRGGKIENYICVGEDCSFCEDGNKPSFKGAFLVWDKRPYKYTDKNGKTKKGKGQLKLFVQGARVLSQLDRISSKYGLTNRDVTISRSGTGQNTSYVIDRGDECKYSKSEIIDMLPEKLRDKFTGKMDSLYSIVEEQLNLLIGLTEDSEDDEDEDDEEIDSRSSNKKYNKNVVSIDDEDDEDEDDDYDEDEDEEDEPVRKSSKSKPKKLFGKR